MDPDGDKSQTDAPTYCADETRAKGDPAQARRTWHKAHRTEQARSVLQQGRKDRIQRQVTKQRIGKGDLHRAIDWGEIELVGGKKVYGACSGIPASRSTSSPKAIVAGLMSCP